MFVGEGATAHRLVLDGQSISSSSVQSANNKMPVSSVFNDSEGLYRTTVCLVRKPHYSARQMRFGSRVRAIFFFSDTPPKCPNRDCVGRRRTGTRHGNVYRSVREKQGIVVILWKTVLVPINRVAREWRPCGTKFSPEFIFADWQFFVFCEN